MATNPPLIGSLISLVSTKEIRYVGTLYDINTAEATVALQGGLYVTRVHQQYAGWNQQKTFSDSQRTHARTHARARAHAKSHSGSRERKTIRI